MNWQFRFLKKLAVRGNHAGWCNEGCNHPQIWLVILLVGYELYPNVVQGRSNHIKYCEPETDTSCTNANYRLVTPRDLPQMARGGLWGHHQALLGVLDLYFFNTMQMRS